MSRERERKNKRKNTSRKTRKDKNDIDRLNGAKDRHSHTRRVHTKNEGTERIRSRRWRHASPRVMWGNRAIGKKGNTDRQNSRQEVLSSKQERSVYERTSRTSWWCLYLEDMYRDWWFHLISSAGSQRDIIHVPHSSHSFRFLSSLLSKSLLHSRINISRLMCGPLCLVYLSLIRQSRCGCSSVSQPYLH